ncbi:MAG TPA: ABC transporter permease, partial [Verrucomicrobiae bacterium]|nr:ABC transporter permease [Verrucomicrobiae bacterium]
MLSYIIKRLLHLIPILLGVSLLTFLLMSLTPGDYFTQLSQNPQISPETLAQLRAAQHLDKPWFIRYGYWLGNALRGDLGYSLAYKTSATQLIMSRLWNTFLLSLGATILAWSVAVPLGIWAAVNKDSWVDRLCSMIAFVGLSVPDVLLALLALMFAAKSGLFPVGGAQSSLYDLMTPREQIWDRL